MSVAPVARPGVTLYVGLDAGTLQGRRFNLTGPRMWNWTYGVKWPDRKTFAGYGPNTRYAPFEVPAVRGMCDSGAFQHVKPGLRVTPADALAGQLLWEDAASDWWGREYRHREVVSYDRLIDEKWVAGRKVKERWSVADADAAVRETVDAAAYLDSQRGRIGDRTPVMGCQGVDAAQYAECAAGVLRHCRPGDVFGLGGWCILGRQRRWLPTFWAAIRRVIPLVAAAKLSRVHIFGVMWQVPLGGLLWLADRYGLEVSTDSKKAAADVTWTRPDDRRRAGAQAETWEENIAWWRRTLGNLRGSPHYREPPVARPAVQQTLFS